MNTRFAFAWAPALVLGLLPGFASGQTQVSVIEPGTNKLVHFARVVVRPISPPGQPIAHGLTGLSGEPWVLPALPASSRTTLEVVATKDGISGTLRLAYDSDRDFWKPNHTLGDWRPEVVYTFDQLAKQWRAIPFAQWKAPHVARKQAFAQIEAALALALSKDQVDAETQAAGAAAQTALADLMRQGHIRSDLKLDLDRTLEALTTPAPQTAISSEGVKSMVTCLLSHASTRGSDRLLDSQAGAILQLRPGIANGL